jgi:beta-glucuronidase
MRSFTPHLTRNYRLLDGVWSFTFLGSDLDPETVAPEEITFDDRLPVPSAWDAYPAYAGKRGTAAYRTGFIVPAGSAAFLRFRGTGMWNRVFVDGVEAATFSLPYSEVEVEVPSAAFEKRELIVVNDNRFNVDRVPLQYNEYDFYAYGGIFRSVELHVVPKIYISRAFFVSPDAFTGKVDARIRFSGIDAGKLGLTVTADEKVVWKSEVDVRGGEAAITFKVPEAKPWSAAEPNLHTIRLQTGEDDLCQRIGFRRVSTEGGKISINGEPVKLLGYCRHEAHPQFGPALPIQQHVQDLQILKDLGCNFVRGSHYAQDPEFLHLCDELGFYVFEESLGWGNREAELASPAFCSGQLDQTRRMVEKSFNHPSVIMWGYMNEGGSGREAGVPLYRDLYQLCRSLDPTRPITYASNVPLWDLCYEYCDIVSVNIYPGWYAKDKERVRPLDEINEMIDEVLAHLEKTGQSGKPFILSEIGAGAIYGWRDPLNAHWTEDYQADYLDVVCKRVVSDGRINGVSLWQFCDGRTYASSRALFRPRAFNNKGTVDEYRRPKMAYKVVRQWFRSAAVRANS